MNLQAESRESPAIQTDFPWVTFLNALLGLIIVLGPHPTRFILWSIEQYNVFIGFRAAMFFLYNFPLLLLSVIWGLRLLLESKTRTRFSATVDRLLDFRYGGLWWLLLLLWTTVSSLWAAEPSLVYYGMLQTLGLLLLAAILADMAKAGELHGALVALALGAGLQAVLGMAQFLNGDALGLSWLGEVRWDPDNLFGFSGQDIFRAYGLTTHPNILGGYLIVGLFAVLALLQRDAAHIGRAVVWAVLLLVIGAGILMTLSRGAVLSGMAALTVLAALTFLRGPRRANTQPLSRQNRLSLLLIGAVLLAAMAVLGVVFWDEINSRFNGLDDPDIMRERIFYQFDNTTDVIADHPVLGVGEGNLMLEIGRRTFAQTDPLLPAHNVYVVVLAELGVFGLLLLVLAMLPLWAQLFQRHTYVARVWLVAVLVCSILMFFDYYLWVDHRLRMVLFWVLGIAAGYLLREESQAPLATNATAVDATPAH